MTGSLRKRPVNQISVPKTTSKCNVPHCVEDTFKQNYVEIKGKQKPVNQVINKSSKPKVGDKVLLTRFKVS